MTKEQIAALEVKPEKEGWYFVNLFQFEKDEEKYPDEFNEFIYFNGMDYDYTNGYEGCYVSNICWKA